MNELYGFFYNSCIHESAYGLMSIHRTKEGAEKAMNAHKEQERIKFEDGYKKRMIEDFNADPELNEESRKILIESLGDFDDHTDWRVDPLEIED